MKDDIADGCVLPTCPKHCPLDQDPGFAGDREAIGNQIGVHWTNFNGFWQYVQLHYCPWNIRHLRGKNVTVQGGLDLKIWPCIARLFVYPQVTPVHHFHISRTCHTPWYIHWYCGNEARWVRGFMRFSPNSTSSISAKQCIASFILTHNLFPVLRCFDFPDTTAIEFCHSGQKWEVSLQAVICTWFAPISVETKLSWMFLLVEAQ